MLSSSDPASVRGLRVPVAAKVSSATSSSDSKAQASDSSSKASAGAGKPTTTKSAKKSAVENDPGLLLRRWFRGLSSEERRRVVSIMDDEMAELILLMSLKLKKEGPGMFSEVGQTDDASLFSSLGSAPTETARNRSNSLSHLPPYSTSHSNTNTRQSRSLFRTSGSTRRGATSVGVDAPGYASSSSRSRSQTREPILRFRQALNSPSLSPSSSTRSGSGSASPSRANSFSSTGSSSAASSSSGPSSLNASQLRSSLGSGSTKPKSTSSVSILDEIHRLGDGYSKSSGDNKRKNGRSKHSHASSSSGTSSRLSSASNLASSSGSSGSGLKSVEGSSSAVNVRAGRSLFPVRYFDDFFASDLIALNPYTPDEENFLFRKHCSIINNDSFTSRTIQMEQELADAVRLCDAKQYLDTITLSLELLDNTQKFFDVMRVASRGEFLKRPCKMSWDARVKNWLVEPPIWFSSMGYYSFGTFLASQFEMKLWQAYYHFSNIDPRRESGHFGSGASKASAKLTQNRHQDVLVSKSHLVDYWMKLSRPQKTALIRSMGNMIEARVKLDLSDLSYPQLLNFLLKLTSVSHNVSNANNPLLQPNNEREFIDFIFLSPLRRAGTGVDLVLRRLGVFIETAYVDQQRADLILGEKMEKEKAKSKRNKKKTKTTQPVASSSDSHTSSTPKSNVETASAAPSNTTSASSSNTSAVSVSLATPSSTPSTDSSNLKTSSQTVKSTPEPSQPTLSTSTVKPASTSASSGPIPPSTANTSTEVLTESQLAGFTVVAGRRKSTFNRSKDDSAAPNQKRAPPGKPQARSKDDTHSGTWAGPHKRNFVIASAPTSSNSTSVPSKTSVSTSASSGSGGQVGSPVKGKRSDTSSLRTSSTSHPIHNNSSSTNSTNFGTSSSAQHIATVTAGTNTSSNQALHMKPLSKSITSQVDSMLGLEGAPLSPSSSSSGTTNNSTASTSTPQNPHSAMKRDNSSSKLSQQAGSGQSGATHHSGSSGTVASVPAAHTHFTPLKTSSESLPAPSQFPEVVERLELQMPLRSRPTSSPPAPQLHALIINPSASTSATSSNAPSPSSSSLSLHSQAEYFPSHGVLQHSSERRAWGAGSATSGSNSQHASDEAHHYSLRSSASDASSTASSSDYSSSGFSNSTPTYSATSGTSGTSGGNGGLPGNWLSETMSDHAGTSLSRRLDALSDRPYPTHKTRTLPALFLSSPSMPTSPRKRNYSQSSHASHASSHASHQQASSHGYYSAQQSYHSSTTQPNQSFSLASSPSSSAHGPIGVLGRSGSAGTSVSAPTEEIITEFGSARQRMGDSSSTPSMPAGALAASTSDAQSTTTTSTNTSRGANKGSTPIATKSLSISAQPYYPPPYPATLSPPRSAQLHNSAMRQSTPPGRLQGMDPWYHLQPQAAQAAQAKPYQTHQNSQFYQPSSGSQQAKWVHVPLEFGPGSALPPEAAIAASASHSATHAGPSSQLTAIPHTIHSAPVSPYVNSNLRQRSTDDHGVVPSRHGRYHHELAPADRSSGNWKSTKTRRHMTASTAGSSGAAPTASTSGNSRNNANNFAHPDDVAGNKNQNGKLHRTAPAILPMSLDHHPLAYIGGGLTGGAAVNPQGGARNAQPFGGPVAAVGGAALALHAHGIIVRAPPAVPEPYRVELPARLGVGTQTLTQHILNFVARVDAVVGPRTAIVLDTVAQVQRVVDECFPDQHMKAEMYGSFSTNLGIPTSDVDLVVKRAPATTPVCPVASLEGTTQTTSLSPEGATTNIPLSPREVALAPLTSLYSALTRETWVRPEKMQLIDTASVPVIKLCTLASDLPVDITMEDGSKPHTGLLTRSLTQQFCEQFPTLRPLALVLKQMLHDCGLHNIYTGGISSYFLIILLVSYLQLYGPTSTNLGELLINFLDLYGNRFNFSTTQISILGSGSHTLLPASAFHPPTPTDGVLSPPFVPPLHITDPLNPSNTVGQSVFGMWQVQLAFRNAFAVLHTHFLDETALSRDHPAIDQLLATVLSQPPT